MLTHVSLVVTYMDVFRDHCGVKLSRAVTRSPLFRSRSRIDVFDVEANWSTRALMLQH